jgi:iron complex outermembrane recepter protein
MKGRILLASTILAGAFFALPVAAQTTTTAATTETDADENVAPEDELIVVTGVFGATSIEKAPISISNVSAEEISQQAPVSAADLLRNVPGVFVNSSLGEIRNVVFSRGVSANSLDAAGGYFYVSLQEDGMPVEPITGSNFGPDYFTRADVMLDHLEALRGGTAVITGANAPGGIFNYISRTGLSNPGIEARVKVGLEGDGNSPYYRGDLYAGGQLGQSDLYYSIGGFYRYADGGARDPGYASNRGGQIRGNLLWDYGDGSFLVTAKYLNDRNGFFEFLPARDFNDPKIIAPFTNTSSVLPEKSNHDIVYPDGTTESFDPSNLVHAKSISGGVNWKHNLADWLTVEMKVKGSKNHSHWNTGALISVTPLTDADRGIATLTGTIGLPGLYTFRNRADGSIAAQVLSTTGTDRTVVVNNLPNQSVLANGVLTSLGFARDFKTKSFQDQVTFAAKLGRHTLSFGGFASLNTMNFQAAAAGGTIAAIGSQPIPFDITLTTGGQTYQVTAPSGYGGINRGAGFQRYFGSQDQFSQFIGDTWEVNDRLTLDVGARHEFITYDITNQNAVSFAGNPLLIGGDDGNPLTLYDNGRNTLSAPIRTKRKYDFWAFTGSAAYQFSDTFQAYVRYTDGRKAPDFGSVQALNSVFLSNNVYVPPQKIRQAELGLKYRNDGVSVQVYPFYSKLSNVSTTQSFTYRAGPSVGQLYTTPPIIGEIETYGVEVEADIDIASTFNIRTALTLQHPRSRGFGAYTQGAIGDGTDDVFVAIPEGDADNNPKIMARTTATWTPIEQFSLFATHNYTGKRAANRRNAFYLPGFSTVDLGASFNIGETFTLQANVNNVFNSAGVLSYGRSGGLLSILDRQGLTPAQVAADPNMLFSVLSTQPRAYYLTGTVKF